MNADSESERFFWIPRQLIDKHLEQPELIAVYGVIVRSWIAAQGEFIALSDQDILTLCPDLNRGKLLRIKKRLIIDGWIMTSSARGKKTEYLPCWRSDVPWRRVSGWGRPSGLRTVRVDPKLYDLYLGRCYHQAVGGIVVERYIDQPLSLMEIGSYILALRTPQPHQSTPMLDQLELIDNGEPQPLPNKDTFIQFLAEHNLLSPYGQRYVQKPKPVSGSSFYLTHNMICMLICMLIAKLIDPIWIDQDEEQAPREDSEGSTNESIESAWSPCTSWISCTCDSPCHTEQKNDDEGGQEIHSVERKEQRTNEEQKEKNVKKRPARKKHAADTEDIMSNKGAALLHDIGVSGKKIQELYTIDEMIIEEVVQAAHANMRLYNRGGWVVRVLETVQTEGIDEARRKWNLARYSFFNSQGAAQDIKRQEEGEFEEGMGEEGGQEGEEGVQKEGNIQDGPEKTGGEVGLVYDLPKLDHKPSAESEPLKQHTTSSNYESEAQEEAQEGGEEREEEALIEAQQAPGRDITDTVQKYVHDRRHWIFKAIVQELKVTVCGSDIQVTVASPEAERTSLSHRQILKELIEDAIEQPCWNIEIKRGYTVHDAPKPTVHQSQVVTAPAWIEYDVWQICPAALKGILSQAKLNEEGDLVVPLEFQRRGLEQQRHELVSLFGPSWATKQILCIPHKRPVKPRRVWEHRP